MDGDGDNGPPPKPPFNLRTLLLALPNKRRCTKKYYPPPYIPGKVETGVRPGAVRGIPEENWRINLLSLPNPKKKIEKYVFVPEEGCGSGVHPSTLLARASERTDHLARPPMNKLISNKRLYKFRGPSFLQRMDKFIDKSWNSIYNYYKKCLFDLKQKRKAKRAAIKAAKANAKKAKDAKGKGVKEEKPKTEKELKEEKEKRIAEWCAVKALPKKIPPPTPLPPRKIADLVAMAGKVAQLAEPRFVTKKYLRPSIDYDYVDPLRVPDSARKYEITERVRELAKSPAHRLVKEPVYKPGAVKRSALTCKVSPRFLELAEPKKKAAEKDSDLKENPFMINPFALKYVATARVQELAKPIDR